MESKGTVTFLAQAAAIAAVYVVLTGGVCSVQLRRGAGARLRDALTILPVFTPAAIPGLFVGCLIANISGRRGASGCHFRQPCDTDRSGMYLEAARSAARGSQRCHR